MNILVNKIFVSVSGLAIIALTPKFLPTVATDYLLNKNLNQFLVSQEIYDKLNLSDEQKILVDKAIKRRQADFEAVKQDCEPKIKTLLALEKNLSIENIQNNINQGTAIMYDAVQKISNIATNYSNDIEGILTDKQLKIYTDSMSEVKENIEQVQNTEFVYDEK